MLIEWRIAGEFALNGRIVDVAPYGRGLINDTYLVSTDGNPGRAILQRINQRVFPDPAGIMTNLRTLLDHVHGKQADNDGIAGDFRLPAICKTLDGRDCYQNGDSGFWRALSFIEDTCCNDAITGPGQAEEIGFALGRFHALVSDLDPGRLLDTLPGFHITPLYLERFRAVLAATSRGVDSPELRYCLDFIETHGHRSGILEQAKHQGLITNRTIHGDPKLNNILFDVRSGHAVSIIDLDTVKPGLIHYDIGDCLRSSCNTANECPENPSAAEFDLDICKAMLTPYLSEAGGFFGAQDYAHLYDAIWLIPFELGLRFATDYLEGNHYFKVTMPEQNLLRAVTQFHLAADIARKEHPLKRMIAELAPA